MKKNKEKTNFDVLRRIDDEREKRGWSEYTLAKNADLTQSTISTWYRKDILPSITSLECICRAFGITLSRFFLEEDEEQRSAGYKGERDELLSLFDSLNPSQRKAVLELLRSI